MNPLLTPSEALDSFYRQHNLQPGHKPWFIGVYVGCMLAPLPNIETRHRYITQHDLHHLVTGYGVGRIGEGEVSAWELGTGSAHHPVLGFMNLIALSTGLFLNRGRMWAAFERGLSCRNLYAPAQRAALEMGEFPTLQSLRDFCLDAHAPRTAGWKAKAEFWFYAAVALAVHGCLSIPAVFMRFFTDTLLQLRLFPDATPQKVKQAMAASKQP